MALTADDVRKIAALARLHLAPDEVEMFVPQLGEILGYVDQLTEYDGVAEEPDASASLEAADVPREQVDLTQQAIHEFGLP